MAKINVRYFVTRPRRDGTPRFYWQPDTALRRSGWKMQRLSDSRHEALQQAEEINARVDEWRAGMHDGPANEKPGTVAALIKAYRKSRHYQDKAPKTRKDYDTYLDLLAQWAGDAPAGVITKKDVQDLYETHREAKPRKAAYLIQVGRVLFNFAENQSWIAAGTNPFNKPKLDYQAGRQTIWSQAEIDLMVRTADEMGHFDMGTAIYLNNWCGQRKGDLITLPMAAYRDGCLFFQQSKTGERVELPVDLVPELQQRLDQQLRHNKRKKVTGTTLIQTKSGRPFKQDYFDNLYKKIRERAAETLPDIRNRKFQTLRHTAVVRLAEAGCDAPLIASVTGHSIRNCNDILETYNVRTREAARRAFEKRLNRENEDE